MNMFEREKSLARLQPDHPGRSVVLEKISKLYGSVHALNSISLAVGEGEFLTLLGPSGSGKTTCLQIMAGIVRPDSGELRIAGRDVTRVPMHKRNIGMLFQSYALFPHMSVAENVLYPLRMRGWPKEKSLEAVRKTLELVKLQDFEDRRPEQLSGGQQQRVTLARAIVFTPSVLLLDEPLSALDRVLREEMQLELRRLHEITGMATVCVTHDRTEALTMSDRVVLLNQGAIVQVGSPREIYDRSGSLFAAQFLGEINVIRMNLSTGDGFGLLEDSQGRRIAGVHVHTDVGDGPVDVAVRVENISLSPSVEGAPEGRNEWDGVVTEAVFLGDGNRYTVNCRGLSVVARVPRGASSISLGDKVTVHIQKESVLVFPKT